MAKRTQEEKAKKTLEQYDVTQGRLLKIIRLGMIVYVLRNDYQTDYEDVVEEKTITKIGIDSKDKRITLAFDHTRHDQAYWDCYNLAHAFGKTHFLSEKKAINVANSKNRITAISQAKYQAKQRIREQNQEAIDSGKFEDLIGRYVMVRVSHDEYEKKKIFRIDPTTVEGDFMIIPGWGYYNGRTTTGNKYLFSRKGKNWYFWSKIKELEEERARINAEIRKERKKEKGDVKV